MATLAFVVGLAVLVGIASSNEVVWSSVAFILAGEGTPFQGPYSGSESALTSLGAQQMNNQGSNLRARYLTANVNLTAGEYRLTSEVPIYDIDPITIDNSELYIAATSDVLTSASAQAFMQSLYPPTGQSFAAGAGGVASAVLANGTLLDYPLGGYQYPYIQTFSTLDPTSIWIEGHASCIEYQATGQAFRHISTVHELYESTLTFYHDLHPRIYSDAFSEVTTNFYFADELYDYAQFVWNHNQSATDIMTEDELSLLRTLASVQQMEQNGNLTYSGFTEGDMIRVVAGRTLADKIVSLFESNREYEGQTHKLNLLFGAREPFISFFALAGLEGGVSSAVFRELPNPGAVMVFELFSMGNTTALTKPPGEDDLYVRFLYRNGTDDDAALVEYPLFGNGPSQATLPYVDFAAGLEKFAIKSTGEWCEICGSDALFCQAIEDASPSDGSHRSSGSKYGSSFYPTVAGVIGAAVTIGVIGLATLVAIIFGGLRFHRHGWNRSTSGGGGFKGPGRSESDEDVVVSSGGARHERTGSWEMKGSKDDETSAVSGAASLSKGFDASDAKSIDDDNISVMNATPVKVREEV